MEYFALVLAILGCILCPFWIKKPRDNKDRGYGIFTMCGSVLMLAASLYMICFNNDILFFSQKKDAINARINIDESIVEDSSILYFFEDYIDNNITSTDVEELLGNTFVENSYAGSYSMRYSTSQYTLNGVRSDYIFAYFNKSGSKGKIRSITWQYENSDRALYYELLSYLSSILGEPNEEKSSKGTLTADWSGFHLECDDYRVSFGRVFS